MKPDDFRAGDAGNRPLAEGRENTGLQTPLILLPGFIMNLGMIFKVKSSQVREGRILGLPFRHRIITPAYLYENFLRPLAGLIHGENAISSNRDGPLPSANPVVNKKRLGPGRRNPQSKAA